jgi:para-nitrobenzyl esterase
MKLLQSLVQPTFAAVVSLVLAGCGIRPGDVPQIVDADDARAVTVLTRSGPVVGASAAAGTAFLGIPYAAPPLGDLRWKPPQPVTPWSAPRDARKLGSACTQAVGMNAGAGEGGGLPFGDEDCLYLNVYTPAAAPAAGVRWPVMTYLPGGAFVLGAGDNYDPSRLAIEQNVIVVTVNYRLGALGFLAHPALTAETPSGASGNAGLLDQQAALRWVRDNIASFGGDPGQVTLFGESAGAWSACYQLASPGAAGLSTAPSCKAGPASIRYRWSLPRKPMPMACPMPQKSVARIRPPPLPACARCRRGHWCGRRRPGAALSGRPAGGRYGATVSYRCAPTSRSNRADTPRCR